jgi:signal transduction histidine kinase
MNRIRRLARAHGVDALIVLTAIASAVDLALRTDSADAPGTTLWFSVPAVSLMVLVLLGRRRFAFGAPASLWIAAGALSFVDGRLVVFPTGVFVAGFAAAFLLGNLRDPFQARTGLAIVIGGASIVVFNDPSDAPGDFVFIPLMFGIGWLAGYAMRERAERATAAEQRATVAEREREAAARIAVAEERTRIARELHDIVAHAVSVMVLQVGAVRHKLPESAAANREALEGVEEAGRTALAEMRRLLGAMRSSDDEVELAPQPGLADLAGLVQQVERAGLSVGLVIEGDPVPVRRVLDVSAYRIVQEALTNVLKHGHASEANVVVRYSPDEIQLEIRDDGVGATSDNGHGHGLVGIGERVKIFGGQMTAGTGAGGGFVLSTRLPLQEPNR